MSSAMQPARVAPAESPGNEVFVFPMSYPQRQLWLLDQGKPGDPAYNLSYPCRLSGVLEPWVLRQALSRILERHEILRTTFVLHDGEPVQLVSDTPSNPLPCIDLTALPAEVREKEGRRLGRDHDVLSFDLEKGPLLRVALVRLATEEHLLLLTLHHIISDAWSLGVLVREIVALYAAGASDPAELPELPIQYADFAVWQRQKLQGKELENQLDFWRQQLGGEFPRLEVPTDRPLPSVRTSRGGSCTRLFPEALAEDLERLTQARGGTLFTTVLACFHLFLHRLSGQGEVIVGIPASGRSQVELEGLIGNFVNTLAICSRLKGPQLNGESPFFEYLEEMRQRVLAAQDHQTLPFELLVEELAPRRDARFNPIYQVMFTLDPEPVRVLRVKDLVLSPVPLEHRTAKVDLIASVTPVEGSLLCELEYSLDLFEATTIDRWLGHFQTLLEGIVAFPEKPLRALSLLSVEQRRQVVESCNRTTTPYPREASLPSLMAEWVRRTPDADAVNEGEEAWSYREVDRRAGSLAAELRRRGLRRGEVVAICGERSGTFVVGVLGILKAGGAYLPLDAQYPRERLAFMLGDGAARWLLTVGDGVPEDLKLPVERLAVESHQEGEPLAAVAVGSSDLAYVMYTSGSSGWPKGVAISHRSVVRLVRSTNYLRLGPESRLGHISAVAFDAATLEIWGALLNGGCIVVLPRSVALAPSELGSALKYAAVSTMFLTAALFNQVVRQDPLAFSAMEDLLVGGEALDPRSMRQVLEGEPPTRLWNGYGPTESTTFALVSKVRRVGEKETTIPIGEPIANTRAYVVDWNLEPVPMGVKGELLLGGDGLAWGYWRRPGLTARSFVPDPLSGGAGERLYRTGDQVLRREGGEVDFSGRLDHQIKLRGFRIELGEIESALMDLQGVDEAVVLLLAKGGDPRLVAYLVTVDEAAVSVESLRQQLRESLPEVMVPAAFVFLEAMPLGATGKLDRKRLAALSGEATTVARQRAPSTAMETVIADTWRGLLQLEDLGVEDDFFELGGHSLLATQLVSRLREILKVEVALTDLFANPTVTALARELEGRRRGTVGEESIPPLEPVDRQSDLPLSFSQQRLWFLDKLDPGSPSYNIDTATRITGRLSHQVLDRSLEVLVRRHEALRTHFESRAGHPVQVVRPEFSFATPVVDLEGLGASAGERETRNLVVTLARTPFALAPGPLWHALVLRTSATDHVLALVMHHIISDGWSLGILVQELGALYEALDGGVPDGDASERGEISILPALELQYADYAVWQRAWLRDERLEAELEYWRLQLEGLPPVLSLPSDRPRPPVRSGRGEALPVLLPNSLETHLLAFGRSNGATLFMTLLAAFQTLLYRYTGEKDFAVGSPIAGRDFLETEAIIGFFVNTLVLRASPRGDKTFRELLAETRNTTLDAYSHQHLPFERLVEELQPERSRSYPPLFQVLLAVQNMPWKTIRGRALTLAPYQEVGSSTAKFDLNLMLAQTSQGVEGWLEFNTDIYDRTTLERFLGHFRRLLEGAVAADGESSLADLPLLAEAEREQLLVEWNQSAELFEGDTVTARFASRVARDPDAVALVCDGREVTYRRLETLSNRLAHYLRRLGAGPEGMVGLLLERSLDLLVAILGTIKAGAAYLPLDLDYPKERLLLMLEEARASADMPLLVTRSDLEDHLPSWSGTVVHLDRERSQIAAENTGRPAVKIYPDSLLYVLFTSGSTGRPKGVAVPHRAAVRLVSEANFAKLDQDQTLLQLAPVSFDASTLEIWGALLTGARLVVPPPGVLSLQEVGTALRENEVTVLWLTAGLFHLMVDQRKEDLALVGQVLAGGDVLSVPHVQAFLEAAPESRLINGYGPTENTTFTCCHGLNSSAELGDSVPIGRAVQGTSVHIVDPLLRLVPVGVAGELVTGGIGLARAYLHRPSLTAERFVPDPFGDGARLYRTGDRVRRRPDGVVEFLGRLDNQVKIRGFRIELGEIEHVLEAHPQVSQAVVVVRESNVQGAEGKTLLAYVVFQGGEVPSAEELRTHLGGCLPGYMIPARFAVLEEMPLGPMGKVDRLQLPEEDGGESDSNGDYRAPRTQMEEVVANIWAELLQIPRVGVLDNFFEIGGHSLLATAIIARIQESFHVHLPVATLFEDPTVAALTEKIEAQMWEAEGWVVPPVESIPRREEMVLSYAQERLWFIDQRQPGNPAYNMPFVLRLKGQVEERLLTATLSEIVRRHEPLRTAFPSRRGMPTQRIQPPRSVHLPVIDLSNLPPPEGKAVSSALSEREARRPFDLARGPVMRVQMVRLDPSSSLVLFTLHHIVGDAWSLQILTRELQQGYRALSRGEAWPFPELAVQAADHAAWQQSWLTGSVLEAHLDYWRERLAGMEEPTLGVPVRNPRGVPGEKGSEVATLQVSNTIFLSPGLRGELEDLCRRQGVTLFMALMGVFQAVLYRYSGQQEITVGTAVAGRTRAELRDLIGFFVNMLVIHTSFEGHPSFRNLLERVREAAVEAYRFQELPLQKLVDELRRPGEEARPLFRAVFALHTPEGESLELGGTRLGTSNIDTEAAKFDLILTLLDLPEGIRGSFGFRSDLLDEAAVALMGHHFVQLLRSALEDPEQSILDIDLDGDSEGAAESSPPMPSVNQTEEFDFEF